MFCYQCEQTAKGTGCTTVGVCGKDATTAEVQDALIHALKGLGQYAHRAAQLGARDAEADTFVLEGLFATLTNVNFDPERIRTYINRAVELRERVRRIYEQACVSAGKQPETLGGPAAWQPASDIEGLAAQGREVSIEKRMQALGQDIVGLQELITYGLKGIAAYAHHAQILGQADPKVFDFIYEALDFLTNDSPTTDQLLGMALRVGEVNLRTMELLDAANTGAYGHPEPTQVRITPVKGKAIVVSGHDLKDLEELLKQTEGKGINVYTHGEMLPANAYPGLKRYGHLVGNYGGAWQLQRKEFSAFPGAILMTTNCIIKPAEDYRERIFTRSVVGYPGVRHLPNYDFSPVIEAALAAPGFEADEPEKRITIGFARNAVLGAAEKVIDLVKQGKIRHFFLIGGCDGAKPGRSYYTELAKAVPDDCIILTLGCGKYRFNKLEFGDIEGIPRLLDMGQCNDAYSAIQVAVALAEAFGTDVNSLPLSLILSWFEQKAVAILLTLLHLGIKNIRLGPSLPAFVTPTVLNVLVDNYNIGPITTPEEDLNACLKA